MDGDAIFHDDAGAEVVDTFYSLIQPEPNYYAWFCQRVYGLGPEGTDDAEVFPRVWEKIAPRIEGPYSVGNNICVDCGECFYLDDEGLLRYLDADRTVRV